MIRHFLSERSLRVPCRGYARMNVILCYCVRVIEEKLIVTVFGAAAKGYYLFRVLEEGEMFC